MTSKSPMPKRIRLDPSASPSPPPPVDFETLLEGAQRGDTRGIPGQEGGVSEQEDPIEVDPEENEDHCVICLHHIRDRTILPCAHDRLCFDCIFIWCQQSRKCPLCNAAIGPVLIHNFRSKYDYSKYYLPPLRTSPQPGNPAPEVLLPLRSGSTPRARRQSIWWGARRRNGSASRERREREDELELAIARRRWVYRHGLYAKHVASNPYTRYRPAPTPSQISASPDLISRATIFVRRELRVWVNLDVEFLTTFILSLMKTLDLRSESAVKLLAEFLDMDTRYHVGDPEEASAGRFTNAEHFSHELYSYLRSPFRDLGTYDSAVQYDIPSHVPPAPLQPLTEQPRWDLHPPTRDEQHSPHHQSRKSSPSPLSRSPRDAYSRSPSPAHSNSYDEYSHPRSPQPGPASLSRRSRSKNINDRALVASKRDTKGKGKFPLCSQTDTWRPHRDENQFRDPHTNDRSRRRLDSPCRSPVQSDVRRAPFVPKEPPHSRFGESDLTRRNYNDRSDRRNFLSNSPPASLPPVQITGDLNEREDVIRDIPTGGKSHLREVDTTVDNRPETPAAPWGISIKGQAKLLDQSRELTREVSDPHRKLGVVEANPTSSVPKKRLRNPSSLDVLHAHLGHGPARRGSTRISTTNDPVKAVDDVSMEENLNPTTAHSTPSDQSPKASLLPQPAPTFRVSAREIMARTRAKLAKLRTESPQTPLVDKAPDTPSSSTAGEITESSPSIADIRARLMQRLEDEKRRVTGRRAVSPGEFGKHTLDHPNGDETPLFEVHETLTGSSIPNRVSSESQQAEIKLRAQALLRVRLAAEKRRADVHSGQISTMSREEALRAKLLSRRT